MRFDNVHFAWNLDGTSAVFERVELTDPARGRVRVVAPELRVEFDTWDYLRHHQFSLGHVTLSSPDIEIIGDPLIPGSVARRERAAASHIALRQEDEAALVRRFTAWAELMPNGRIEVEGARVHLLRRGDRAARTTFTLSQAMVRRDASSFNAFGTMLLSQDVGQSLFLSAKLEGLGVRNGVSGELRVIARRVFLNKLPMLDATGRGTLDATLQLQAGLVSSASWQASARELEIGDDPRARFDHFTVNGKLERDAGDFVLQFADLQLTRDARLERAPKLIGASQRRARHDADRAHDAHGSSECRSWRPNSWRACWRRSSRTACRFFRRTGLPSPGNCGRCVSIRAAPTFSAQLSGAELTPCVGPPARQQPRGAGAIRREQNCASASLRMSPRHCELPAKKIRVPSISAASWWCRILRAASSSRRLTCAAAPCRSRPRASGAVVGR